MNTLCKKGVHIALTYGTEKGKEPSEFRLYRACTCQAKKKFLYGGQSITNDTLMKPGTF